MAYRCGSGATEWGIDRHRLVHRQQSELVIGGMVLLLATCGWMVGGEEGARWAVRGGTGSPDDWRAVISPDAMYRQFGARLIQRHEWPALFDMLGDISRRARLPRIPDIYHLPDAGMNAYALGCPEASAITLTEGLLRGMTRGEIAGILAHEVGHIRNNDGWALNLAAALHRATALTALMGLAGTPCGTTATVLSSAPMIGQMLHMTLSRIREFDADAVALHLVDDPRALVEALHKLEHHHGGSRSWRPERHDDGDLLRFLRSHPETWERVGTLIRLAAH